MPAETEKLAARASKVTMDETAKTETAATAVPECEKTEILCEVGSTSCKAQSGVKCWNCDHLMEPDHQCGESSRGVLSDQRNSVIFNGLSCCPE